MRLVSIPCDGEIHAQKGVGGTLLHGSIEDHSETLRARYAGQVQTIYLDPPFCTGKNFSLRQRCGEAGWLSGKPMLSLPAYTDKWPDRDAFLSMLRRAIVLAHELLSEDGSLFLHLDARMHARVRLMADEVFGENNFVNEIIWTYQTGGRSTAHFSRKHDIILFYRKRPDAYFNIQAVGVPRTRARSNHMRRGVDSQGRPYRSIVSQGKEYRYYDDEHVYPGDVWDDVSHMQQKDPQRTGYDNQKPLKLLERVILSTSRPGDLVCDLFAGSGTTAVAAAKHGRNFIVVDRAEAAVAVARKRLLDTALQVEGSCAAGSPLVFAEVSRGLGFNEVCLTQYVLEEGLCRVSLPGIEAVDQISVGYLRGGIFHGFGNAARSKLTPGLPERLELPVLDGTPAVLTVDVLGRRMVHALEEGHDGE